jgi:hypothetical protein
MFYIKTTNQENITSSVTLTTDSIEKLESQSLRFIAGLAFLVRRG